MKQTKKNAMWPKRKHTKTMWAQGKVIEAGPNI